MATSILGLSELRPSLLLRQLASECIGTLLLVIVGCGRSLPFFFLCWQLTSPGWSVPSLATTCLKRSFIYIPCLESIIFLLAYIFCLEHINTSNVTSQLHRGSLSMSASLFLGFLLLLFKSFHFFLSFSRLLSPSNMTSQLHGGWWPGWQKPARGPGGDFPVIF